MTARRHVRRSAVEAVLGREHLLQLAVVEEDPTAVLTLLDVHALPIDRAHPSLTFRTSHAGQNRGVRPVSGPWPVSNRTRSSTCSTVTGGVGRPRRIAVRNGPRIRAASSSLTPWMVLRSRRAAHRLFGRFTR